MKIFINILSFIAISCLVGVLVFLILSYNQKAEKSIIDRDSTKIISRIREIDSTQKPIIEEIVKNESTQYYKKNVIDKIQNATEIELLIDSIDNYLDENYNYLKVNSKLKFSDCQELANQLKIKPWIKVDFDHNGCNDILIVMTGYNNENVVICILDKKNKYNIEYLTFGEFKKCGLPLVTSYENGEISYFYEYHNPNNYEESSIKTKKLLYKFGSFIEKNDFPTNHKIEKIEFSTSGCYGSCPIYSITIDNEKLALFDAEDYNEIKKKEVKGIFKASITQDKFSEIIAVLNYLDFEKLENSYVVGWTDDQTSMLKITYNNGNIKEIGDYGMAGTFGLCHLYSLLYNLRDNQTWKR